MEKITVRALAIGLLFYSLSFALVAHQQKQALTNLLLNERSGFVEVDHRFYLHDIEQVLNSEDLSKDLILDSSAQKKVANYIEHRFTISGVDLELVGYEVDGIFFRVYQQASLKQLPATLMITMNALFEVWPDQQNLVNITHQKNSSSPYSLLFSESQPRQIFTSEPITASAKPQ